MATYTQSPHRISVETPLGEDVLNLIAFDGFEEYSRLFRFNLEMFSDRTFISPKEIVGKSVTVSIKHPDDETRYFNGIVSRFFHVGVGDRGTQYRAEVVPWLWFLTRTADCRIFQEMTVPDIIEQIFQDLGFSDFKKELKGEHKEWEYCVQYRETDFNFVARLMEQEGIFYYFTHEDGKHTMHLADDASVYKGDEKVKFSTEVAGDLRNDNIMGWEHQYDYRPGAWMHTDYNFKKPNNTRNPTYEILKADVKTVVDLEKNKKFEIYDYPGEYEEKPEGNDWVKLRMEEEEVPHDVVMGTSICRTFAPCVKFKVEKHRYKHEEGKEYVITSVTHFARVGSYITGGGAAENTYSNSFTCIPSKVVMRPARISPKPVIQGVQTAVVTGPPGEEIYPDEYGRVKVQFHWDREGEMDDKSSCWIRTMQFAAGRGWGSMSIPRIGQEVVVTFLEGDPDRPLISGLVYNAGQMPPYTLPDEKTKTYFKSNSSKGGDGHNEIRFEDKNDEEQIYMHAERNMDVRVKEDSMERVLHDRHEIIGSKKDELGFHRQQVMVDKETNIKRDLIEHVEGNVLRLVGKGEANGGNVDLVVEKDVKEKIEGNKNLTVGMDSKEKIGVNKSVDIGMNHDHKIGMDYAVKAGMGLHLKAGMTCVIEAGVKLSLKVGGSFVDISPAGVAISGPMVLINSGGAAGTAKDADPKAPDEAEEAKPTEPTEADNSETGQKSCPD